MDILGYRMWSTYIPNISGEYEDILKDIQIACKWCNQIIFVLDDITFPIRDGLKIPSFWTGRELLTLCQNQEFFNKTIFVKGDNVIEFDRNLVI